VLGFAEDNAFVFQQPLLQFRAAAEISQAAVGFDHPVAGIEKREGIFGHEAAYRPGGPGVAGPAGQRAVADDHAGRDPGQAVEDHGLERGEALPAAEDVFPWCRRDRDGFLVQQLVDGNCFLPQFIRARPGLEAVFRRQFPCSAARQEELP